MISCNMRKLWIVAALLAVFALAGCAGKTPTENGSEAGGTTQTDGENGTSEADEENTEMYLTIGDNK